MVLVDTGDGGDGSRSGGSGGGGGGGGVDAKRREKSEGRYLSR